MPYCGTPRPGELAKEAVRWVTFCVFHVFLVFLGHYTEVRMHNATRWTGLWLSLVVWTMTAAGGGCRGTGQESTVTNAEQSEASERGTHKPKELEIAETVFSSPAVFAGQELGMTLSGPGDSGRSLAGLEHAMQTFLPQLQAVYIDELQQEPSLMGSLEVKLTIEANGTVSDLRFLHVRLSAQQFKTAIFDHMRAWVFPPAAKQVQFRSRLLFVPAGIDYTAILTWESYLDGQTGAVGRGEPLRIVTAPAPVTQVPASLPASSPASASSPDNWPGTEAEERPEPPLVAAGPKLPRAPAIPELHGKPAQAASASDEPAEESAKEPAEESAFDPYAQAGWYRVMRATLLYRAPSDSSVVVAQLHQGMRVQAVATVAGDNGGEWLEIHSVTNRPPGFVRRQDVKRDVQRDVQPDESDIL